MNVPTVRFSIIVIYYISCNTRKLYYVGTYKNMTIMHGARVYICINYSV